MARILKEIIAASYKIGIHMDAVTKMIENTRESMTIDSHMTFASKPPDALVIEWYLAVCDSDKDVNYFCRREKNTRKYDKHATYGDCVIDPQSVFIDYINLLGR